VDSVYNLDDDRFNSYGFESNGRPNSNLNSTSGSTALYHHNGSRYGLGLPGRTASGGADSKMNGLHGPKHKRGDIDRECEGLHLFLVLPQANACFGHFFKSIVSLALAWKICRVRFRHCAKTSMVVGTCKRSWRRELLSIAT
jgi:hypothetical protein